MIIPSVGPKKHITIKHPTNGRFFLEASFDERECQVTERNGSLIFKENGQTYSLKKKDLEIYQGIIPNTQESLFVVHGENGKQRKFQVSNIAMIPLLKTFVHAIREGKEMPPVLFPQESLANRYGAAMRYAFLKGASIPPQG